MCTLISLFEVPLIQSVCAGVALDDVVGVVVGKGASLIQPWGALRLSVTQVQEHPGFVERQPVPHLHKDTGTSPAQRHRYLICTKTQVQEHPGFVERQPVPHLHKDTGTSSAQRHRYRNTQGSLNVSQYLTCTRTQVPHLHKDTGTGTPRVR